MKKYLKNKISGFKIVIYTIFIFVYSTVGVYAAKPNNPNVSNLGNKNFQQLITDFILVATQYITTLLIALTVLTFLYGLMKYMYKGQSSDTARSEGRKLMLWGIIGLFVMTSVWGLVTILASVIGHNGVVIPQF